MHIQPPAESACASNMFVSYFASKYADVGTASCFCRVCFTSDDFLLHVPSFGVSLIKFYFSCVKPLVFLYFSCAYRPALFRAMCMLCYFMKHQRELLRLLLQLLPFFFFFIINFRHLTHLPLHDMSITKSLALQASFPLLPKVHLSGSFALAKLAQRPLVQALCDCKQHLPIGSSSVCCFSKKKKNTAATITQRTRGSGQASEDNERPHHL